MGRYRCAFVIGAGGGVSPDKLGCLSWGGVEVQLHGSCYRLLLRVEACPQRVRNDGARGDAFRVRGLFIRRVEACPQRVRGDGACDAIAMLRGRAQWGGCREPARGTRAIREKEGC